VSRALTLATPGPIGSAPLRMAERRALVPGPDELLVAVGACAVCRTDLQLVEGDLELHRHPIVPGHQVVGEVVTAGPRARTRVGERVGVTWLAGVCGRCEFCTSGRENLCTAAAFHGWDRDGGSADHMLVRDDFAFVLPAGRTDAEVAPLLCAGVIGHRALRMTEVEPGNRLGLYGFGSSASLVLQLAIDRGIVVHVATRNDGERRRALRLGASSVGGYDETPPEPLHAAITFAPVGRVVVHALAALRRGGSVVVNAIHLDEVPAFDYDLLWHERSVRSVANVTRRDITELLTFAARTTLEVEQRIYGLADANRALADLSAGGIGATAVLVP